ncbi:hypothetical protein RCC89_14600 [Cytophagaceae bacterium ABcell3]|nr:hypothetical protein RCC89_14600 [Cytophagaceae bacterium ABcell3]
MEKVSYSPLVDHLRENATVYNQLYLESEIRHGTIDGSCIAHWMVGVVEPAVKELLAVDANALPQITKAFYTELLRLLGSKAGVVYEKEYRAAWSLCEKNPMVFLESPLRALRAINTAVESILFHQPESALRWVSQMEKVVPHCQSIDEFLSVGRICAWFCGMAHLKGRAKEAYQSLRKELKKVLQKACKGVAAIGKTSKQEWANVDNGSFIGEAGGFVGYGGFFYTPPLVTLYANEIVASDKSNSYAFFADNFGKIFLSGVPVLYEDIVGQTEAFKNFLSQYGKQHARFEDVTSSVVKNNTLVFTRKSSHYLYLYKL